MRTLLLVLSACCITSVAGPIPFFPGQHPNYDAQVDATQAQPYPEIDALNREFPQYTIAYQPPLIGYLSYANPAEWIVWTTARNPFDPFEQAALSGEPGPLFPPIDNGPPPPNPGGGEIPEPSSGWLACTAAAAAYGMKVWRARSQRRS